MIEVMQGHETDVYVCEEMCINNYQTHSASLTIPSILCVKAKCARKPTQPAQRQTKEEFSPKGSKVLSI